LLYSADVPVIILIQAWGSEKDFKNGYLDCWNDGHFVVVVGYTDKMILDDSLHAVCTTSGSVITYKF
jgi:hypothetical protein